MRAASEAATTTPWREFRWPRLTGPLRGLLGKPLSKNLEPETRSQFHIHAQRPLTEVTSTLFEVTRPRERSLTRSLLHAKILLTKFVCLLFTFSQNKRQKFLRKIQTVLFPPLEGERASFLLRLSPLWLLSPN